MKELRYLLLGLFVALTLIFAGCGGGGGSSAPAPGTVDTDGDGIPNADDAFPTDPSRFANFQKVVLPPLALDQAAYAVAVNDNALPLVVGLALNAQGVFKAVTWAAMENSPPAITLNALSVGETLASAAYGVNNAGIAVGEAENGTASRAVFWPRDAVNPTALSMVGMSGPRSAAFAINGEGQIVGEAEKAVGNFVPVIWNRTSADPDPFELPLGSATTGSAYAVGDGGWIAGEADGKAVYWTVAADGAVAGPIELPLLDGHETGIALGVDSAGRFVGESETATGTVHGVSWIKNSSDLYVAVDLGPASAQAINEGHRIAGYGGAGSASRAAVWDTRLADQTNFTAVLDDNKYSQAYGINQTDVIVGSADHQAFAALPK